MNDQAAKLFAGQMSVCAVLVDMLIDKGIITHDEFFDRFQQTRALAGQTVLVVEEDPPMARELLAVLENAGAEVLVARNAAEALSRIAQFDFSAAVLDWRPERREHRAATRWLREDGVRILFYAEHPPEDAMAACGDPILVKPAPPDEIVRALAQLTGAVSVERTVGAA